MIEFRVYGRFTDKIDIDEEEFEKYLSLNEEYMNEPEGEVKDEWREEILHDFACEKWDGSTAELEVDGWEKY